MSGGFPAGLDICGGFDVGTVLTNAGVTVTGGLNTPGAWTQIVASTTRDACWMEVSVFPTTGASFVVACDIAVGASGSEKAIANKLLATSGTGRGTLGNHCFPVNIPAGTRISARFSCSASTDTNQVNIRLYDGAFTQIDGCAGVDAIGFNAATTGGTTLTSGSPAGTKGAWAQLIAATARDYIGFSVIQDRTSPVTWGLLDVAIGASGSETIIKPNYGWAMQVNLSHPSPIQWTAIPSGTRIAARFTDCYNATSSTGITLYGIYQ